MTSFMVFYIAYEQGMDIHWQILGLPQSCHKNCCRGRKTFQSIILWYFFTSEKINDWLWEDFIYCDDSLISISSFTGNTILDDKNAVSHRYSKRMIESGWRKWSRVPSLVVLNCVGRAERYIMMTSSNRNIFRVTGPLCGEFTGHRWIPLTKASDAELWCFLWPASRVNGWVNNREAGDLGHHRAHYDVIVMYQWHSARLQ